ncbi:MAG TPA: Maf family protein [Bacillota bacterium]|nr:Maf family protein [Bacillota bacterium]
MTQQLILASASPRRADILKQIGFQFQVIPSRAPEENDDVSADPAGLVMKLALNKAKEVAGSVSEGLIIGADTIVVAGERILGKPTDAAHAFEMLTQLSGKTHAVFTGLALVEVLGHKVKTGYEKTEVTFRAVTSAEIWAYIATNEPFDKAGAYGIQGRGAVLVEGIRGCFYNVVGLPVSRLIGLLQEFGVDRWERKR